MMRQLNLSLALIGTVLPYSQFLPWLAEHGPNIRLLFTELFSTRAGARRKMHTLSLPIAATCLVDMSCGLPLFLYLCERQLTGDT
jgi:Terpene cyclase DEP1